MFGYVTPLTAELKIKEHTLYQSLYCGLCRAMGKHVCQESRVTLSYDVVFLVLIRLAISGDPMTFRKARCGFSPFKKRVVMDPNPTLAYCAAAGSLLAYYHLVDDEADKTGLAGLKASLLRILGSRLRKKAGLPELDAAIAGELSSLTAAEKRGDATLDETADGFGRLLKTVFGFGLEGSGRRIAEEIGYHVGKWIYMIDAADDCEKDRKTGNFNPLARETADRPDAEEADGPLAGEAGRSLYCAMTLELEAAASAFALLDEGDPGIKSITENILYQGMPDRMKRVWKSREPDGRQTVTS